MKRIFAIALVLTMLLSFVPFKAVSAQSSCTYSCYWATVVRLKNSNGTNFNGTAKVYNGANVMPNGAVITFVDGLGYYNGNVLVLSGYQPYSWYNIRIDFDHPTNGTWLASVSMKSRYSSPPTIPSVTTATMW